MAWLTKEGIAVSALRETSGLGWFRGGGWVLEGGLLAKLESQEYDIELYGKLVFRNYPVFFLLFHSDNSSRHGLDFFLLRRNKHDLKATLLKKWTFAAREILPDGAPSSTVKAILRDYIPRQRVTLVVTGLKRPFEDIVNLSKNTQ